MSLVQSLLSVVTTVSLTISWHPASVDLDECISRLYKKELLAESVIEAVCAKTKELLMRESNVVHVKAPITVVGDIHGQFYDLIEIFRIGGYCPDTNYLFLGPSPPNLMSIHAHTLVHMHVHTHAIACLFARGICGVDRVLEYLQATTLIVACSASRQYRYSCA